MTHAYALWLAIAMQVLGAVEAWATRATNAQYRGWQSLALSNGRVTVHVVPEAGGRVMQVALGSTEFLWVNEKLAGTIPSPTGRGPDGSWLNSGGDRLTISPQAWEESQPWPDTGSVSTLDGPYAGRIATDGGPTASIHVASPRDAQRGIRLMRTVSLTEHSSKVACESALVCVDPKPRLWAFRQATMLAATGGSITNLRCYSPLHTSPALPNGWRTLLGPEDNPAFVVDTQRSMLEVSGTTAVGKLGADNQAGWIATVDGGSGCALVQRFTTFPTIEYPRSVSVEFLVCGGGVVSTNDAQATEQESPRLVETAVLSPLVRARSGKCCTFLTELAVTRIGGAYPILSCTAAGVMCEPLKATMTNNPGSLRVTGRFGVFFEGKVLVTADPRNALAMVAVSPLEPLVLDIEAKVVHRVSEVVVLLIDADGTCQGELGRARIGTP